MLIFSQTSLGFFTCLQNMYILKQNSENMMFSELNTSYILTTQSRHLTTLRNKPFENTVGKGEIAHNKQFFFFSTVFSTHCKTFCSFHQFEIVLCKLSLIFEVPKICG